LQQRLVTFLHDTFYGVYVRIQYHAEQYLLP
jgi:hypothetical protein